MSAIKAGNGTSYTKVSNVYLRDKELSMKAKGLMAIILSLPEDWTYSINGLATICKEGQDGITSTVHELEEAGYLARERHRDEHGRLSYSNYVVLENPGKAASEVPQT